MEIIYTISLMDYSLQDMNGDPIASMLKDYRLAYTDREDCEAIGLMILAAEVWRNELAGQTFKLEHSENWVAMTNAWDPEVLQGVLEYQAEIGKTQPRHLTEEYIHLEEIPEHITPKIWAYFLALKEYGEPLPDSYGHEILDYPLAG